MQVFLRGGMGMALGWELHSTVSVLITPESKLRSDFCEHELHLYETVAAYTQPRRWQRWSAFLGVRHFSESWSWDSRDNPLLRHHSIPLQNRLPGRPRPDKSLNPGLQHREIPFQFFFYLLSVYVGIHVYVCTHMSHGTYVEVRRQLVKVNSFPSPCRSRGLNSGHQAWQQAPFSTGSTCWTRDPPLSKNPKDMTSSK